MKSIGAQILEGDEAILDGVDVFLDERQERSFKEWDGFFYVTGSADSLIRRTFRIVLADGRSGEIVVIGVFAEIGAPTCVKFYGKGPLE